jgi:hypothetical protein
VIASLALLSCAGAAALAVWALVGAVLGRRPRGLVTGVLVLEAALAAQGVRDTVGLVAGHRPAEPIVHVGYLVCSLAVPLIALAIGRERDRASALTIALGMIGTVVVIIRMQQSWW